MKKQLEEIVKSLNKKYGEGTIISAADLEFAEANRLPSGSLYLDKLLGFNSATNTCGWPLGRVVELYGPQGSGKSSLSMKTIAEAQKQGLGTAWFDVEHCFESERAKLLGVNVEDLFLSEAGMDADGNPTSGERILEMVCDLLKTGKIGVIVIDSLASLVPKAEIEKSMEDSNRMALAASMMSQALRKITALNKSTLIIFINQLRLNPGMTHGNPEYTPGGKALGYYSSIRVDLRQGEFIINDKKQKIGQLAKFKIVKNKTSNPQQVGSFKFMYSGEIDQADELISIGELEGTITRRGAYYYVGDEGFQGRENLESALKSNPELFEKAKQIVFGAK